MYIGSGNLGSGSSNSGSKFGFGKLCSSVCAKGPTTVYSLQVCLTAPGGGCSSWFGDSHSKNWKPATKPLTRLSWNSCCLKHCHQLEMHRLRHHHQHSSSKTKWLEGVRHNHCTSTLLPMSEDPAAGQCTWFPKTHPDIRPDHLTKQLFWWSPSISRLFRYMEAVFLPAIFW